MSSRLSSRNYLRPAAVSASLLLIPLVAMQFSEEVKWGIGDFIGMGLFIYVFGLLFEFAMVKAPRKYRVLVGGMILFVFLTLYVLMATTE